MRFPGFPKYVFRAAASGRFYMIPFCAATDFLRLELVLRLLETDSSSFLPELQRCAADHYPEIFLDSSAPDPKGYNPSSFLTCREVKNFPCFICLKPRSMAFFPFGVIRSASDQNRKSFSYSCRGTTTKSSFRDNFFGIVTVSIRSIINHFTALVHPRQPMGT